MDMASDINIKSEQETLNKSREVMSGNTTPDRVQMTIKEPARDKHVHSARLPEEGPDPEDQPEVEAA